MRPSPFPRGDVPAVVNLPAYAETEDSGVKWLGRVPEHWEVRRLRSAVDLRPSNVDKHVRENEKPVRLCNYMDVYGNDRILSDIAFMPATATLAEIDRFGLRRGDVLITKDSEDWTDIGVPAVVDLRRAETDILCGYHCALLRPHHGLEGGYLFWLLNSSTGAGQFRVRANGVTRYGLSKVAIGSIRLPLPPFAEQIAIVSFLDYVARRIRRYIQAKEKLIELLEEQQQVGVHQAVTGQVDVRTGRPYPAYKDSGIEWLGKTPTHWRISKIRQCAVIAGGMTPSMEDRRFWDGDVPWVTPKDMKTRVIADSLRRVTTTALAATTLRLVQSPAVLMVVRGMILARKVPIALTAAPVTINQDMKALVPLPALNPAYLAAFLDCAHDGLFALIDEAGHGTRRLPTERWRDLPLPVPPQAEQTAISRYVDHITTGTTAGIERTRRQIALLREWRERLVADAVTGKLNVRGAAAALPQVDSLAGQPV